MMSAIALGETRFSPDDQRDFDKYYTKWVNDTGKQPEQHRQGCGHMQEIMGRNHIPANVPFDQLASTGSMSPGRMYQGWLSADEQREFDKYYTKWVNDTRKNDRDNIAKDVEHMQEIMARKNIPASVSFDQIASTGNPGNSAVEGYPRNQWRHRLSPDDQHDFNNIQDG